MDEKENVIDQRLVLLRRRCRESPWSDPHQPFLERQEPQRQLTVAISREAGAPGPDRVNRPRRPVRNDAGPLGSARHPDDDVGQRSGEPA